MTEHSLHALAMDIRRDLTGAQGKLTELMRQVGALPIDTSTVPIKCPYCELETKGELTLAEHVYNQHDGPVPAHYAAIEAASDEPSADFDAVESASVSVTERSAAA